MVFSIEDAWADVAVVDMDPFADVSCAVPIDRFFNAAPACILLNAQQREGIHIGLSQHQLN